MHKSLKSEEPFLGEVRVRDVMTEGCSERCDVNRTQAAVAGFEERGKAHRPRVMGGL